MCSRQYDVPTAPVMLRAGVPGSPVYGRDASLVLIGIRGAGKSTLAVMASRALGFRLVDADQQFFRISGHHRAAYKSMYGIQKYRQQELEVMRIILQGNQTSSVITCGPGCVEGTGKDILRDFAKAHPVIYIMRECDKIARHLRNFDADYVARFVELAAPVYRASSNFEFFNLSEWSCDSASADSTSQLRSPASLMLKNVEWEFLRLIFNIRAQKERHVEQAAIHASNLLPPEEKPFTYALSLPLSKWSSVHSDFQGLDLAVDAIELIMDLPVMLGGSKFFGDTMATEITRQYYSIRRNTQLPVMFHADLSSMLAHALNTSVSTGGVVDIYFEILHYALRLAPEYLTVDLDCDEQRIRDLVSVKGGTKIIGHSYCHSSSLEGWEAPSRKDKMSKAEGLGCDIVRLCQEATSMGDNLSVQNFVHRIKESGEHRIPLIAYNTGVLGHLSCYMNPTLTPVTHPLLAATSTSSEHDRLLTVQSCQRALYSFVLDKLFFGVFGKNVSASLAPIMHNSAFQFCGMPHEYRVFQYQSLKNLEDLVYDPTFGGASLTSPFKIEAMLLVDSLSSSARAIGAVNTLIPLRSKEPQALLNRNRRGQAVGLYGENTDWIGIHACVLRNLSPINAVDSRTTCLVLGAGGMARAAIYSMMQLGVRNIFVYNRTEKHAEAMANQFRGRIFHGDAYNSYQPPSDIMDTQDGGDDGGGAIANRSNRSEAAVACNVSVIPSLDAPWPSQSQPPTIIVSCVPAYSVGGEGTPTIILPQDWLKSRTGGVLLELAYSPANTPLQTQIQELGNSRWIFVDGHQYLPEQGIAQFELFTGRRAPGNVMRACMPPT